MSAIQHLWQLPRCCGTTVTLLWDNRHAVMRQLSHNADSNLLRVEKQLSRDIFSRQGRKDLDDHTHPLITLANPLRSLCALCGFAREEQLPRDIFSRQAAKVAKEKHGYFCTTFHDLCFFSNDFPLLMLAIARTARVSCGWVRIDSRTD